MGYEIIPEIENFKKYADPNILQLNHGGIVAYVHKSLIAHVFDVQYETCFVSFRLDFAPSFIFIGMYIQPESSRYFSTDLFGLLSDLLISVNERNLIPIMGGDMNCRFGNLSDAFHGKGLYEQNVDIIDNYNGRNHGIDVCNSGNIFPLNHLKYKNRTFDGNYTYFKADKRSQIDFAFTNNEGIKHIVNFRIIMEDWHASDHLPICVDILAPEAIQGSSLLKRARDLNYEFDPQKEHLTRYLSFYDENVFENQLRAVFPSLDESCRNEINNEDIDAALRVIDKNIAGIYRKSKIKKQAVTTVDTEKMKKANSEFENLRKCIRGEIGGDFNEMLSKYQEARNNISKETVDKENQKWKELANEKNTKGLWNKIDWKGDLSKKVSQPPVFEDLTASFEDLYKLESIEHDKIADLKTDVYHPLLDDPITMKEMDDAMGKMKNGGFDHRIDIFRIMVRVMAPLLLLIMNTLFYVTYPANLAVSLLTAIPKKGDLSLATNYRGIQMLRALAVLYDRVIANRLTSWLTVRIRDIQSAFQKGKSVLHQLFTIRLLIEIAKQNNTTLYIGLFDLAKAFDKVSRFRLLHKLVTKGIGNCMLQALKRVYMCTYCVLSYGKEFSEKFRTFTGIRQGAASSTLLFIGFIDDLVEYLEERCTPEPFLDTLHCLLHADDTAIISSNRSDFVIKCNYMLQFFDENELKLNFSKCEYLIINGKENDVKEPLKLRNGFLIYKSVVKYLGMKISDTGNMKVDMDLNIDSKRSSLTIKFGNFCRKNFLAPLEVKLNVLNSCVSSSITYTCEVWGISNVPKLESLYRQGLKTALSIRNNVNNEIVYIETGEWPLQIKLSKQQLNFWLSIVEITQTKPNHYITKLVNAAADTRYIRYYKQLQQTFTTPDECVESMKATFKTTFEGKIRAAADDDSDSRLGAYFLVNPALVKPTYNEKMEFQRVCVSRYRTGSHNLKIEAGRTPHIPRDERYCCCNTGLQTVKHVLLECPLLIELRERYNVVDVEHGVMNECFWIEMEKILDVK